MLRSLAVLALVLGGCDSGGATIDAASIDAAIDAPGDGGPDDAAIDAAAGCDGRCAGVGEACGASQVDQDAGALQCAPGLVCCYPCGIPDCVDRCIEPCNPANGGCQENGCPGPFP